MKQRLAARMIPYVLILPSVIFLALFIAYPMVYAFGLAFTEGGSFTLDYFRTMVTDPAFWPALRTTLLLLVLIIPIQFIVALIMALLVQAKLKFSQGFLYIFSIPLGVSELAAGIIWFAIFTENGFLNSALISLGFLNIPYPFLSYQNQGWLLAAIIIAEVWRASSLVMIILVAGLQAIPNDYLEAADVFGATLWQRVTKVILPLLKPSIQVALILRTILAFQVFAVALAIAGRGITLLAAESYRWYQSYLNPNIAAAYAVVILLLSIVSTVIYLVALRTRPEEMAL
jgi:multiple sugar transport system permease protein